MKFAAYIRVSDKNKGTNESQLDSLTTYCESNGILISKWVTEYVSGSKTDIEERELINLVNDGYSIVMTDITRLGRRKVFGLLGVIDQICRNGELHFSYTNRVVTAENLDDAETIFTVVGGSYAAVDEANKRSQRAKAGHATRKAKGLKVGRVKGQIVKSKLDEHVLFITTELNKGTPKTKILRQLNVDKGIKMSRSRFYTWLGDRGIS